MSDVIRRTCFLFLVLVLAGCAAGSQTSISVGDREVSREDFLGYTQLLAEVQSGGQQFPTAFPGATTRQAATNAVNTLVQIEVLEEATGEELFSEAQLSAAREILDGELAGLVGSAQGQPLSDFVVNYGPDSAGYDLWVDTFATQTFIEQNQDVVGTLTPDDVRAVARTVEIESRLGTFDLDSGQVFPHSES